MKTVNSWRKEKICEIEITLIFVSSNKNSDTKIYSWQNVQIPAENSASVFGAKVMKNYLCIYITRLKLYLIKFLSNVLEKSVPYLASKKL